MEALGSYSLIDFMPMGREVYFRLFVRQNEAVWPSQLLTFALGIAALWLAWSGRGRYLGAVLGVCWGWVGATFHLGLFTELNWAALYIGWAFVAQGLLLLGLGLRGWLDAEQSPSCAGQAGFGLGIFALAIYPFIVAFGSRSWRGAELFGTAPDPTALLTLGLLLTPGRVRWPLTAIPLLWCGFSGATWFAMGWTQGLIVPAAALLFLVAAVCNTWTR